MKIIDKLIGFLLGRKPDQVEIAARARVRAINETRENMRLNNELTQGGKENGHEETSR
jgi:hypothetical protein